MKTTSLLTGLTGAVFMIICVLLGGLFVYLGMSFVYQSLDFRVWPDFGRLTLVMLGIPVGFLSWFLSLIFLNSPEKQLKNITKENQKHIMKRINPFNQEGKIKGNMKVYEEEPERPKTLPKPMRPPSKNSTESPKEENTVFINFDWSNARHLVDLEGAPWPPTEIFKDPPSPPPDRVIKEGGPVRPPKDYGELK